MNNQILLALIANLMKNGGGGSGSGLSFDGPYDSVEDLPSTGATDKIYLVVNGETTDYYDEYYWDEEHETYNSLGTTKLELKDYAKKTDVSEVSQEDAQNDWNAVFGSEFNPTSNTVTASSTTFNSSDVSYED